MASAGAKRAVDPSLSSKMIEDRLTDLPKNGGVWCDGLAAFLGDELSSRLHIVNEARPGGPEVDSTDQLRAKVIWHFRRLVNSAIANEKFRQSARVALNITPHRELRGVLDVEKRIKLGYDLGLCLALTTVRGHMRKHVVPALTRELIGPQPTPPQHELDAIIAELRGEALAAMEPEPAASIPDDDDPVDVAELVAEIKDYWASPTAYSEFDLDTIEGVRDMYRQMMEDAARAVCLYDVSVAEVVAILRSNKARPDISGHDISEMTEQVLWSVERMRQILDDETGAVAIYGRVIDEQGNVVEGVRQVAGSSIRRDKDGEVVGDGPNLISDSEIDAWMRGVLEHAEPAQIAAGTLDAIRVGAYPPRQSAA